jgi:hypothetical protein
MSSRSTPPLSPDDRRFLEGIASFDLSPEEKQRIWDEEKASRDGYFLLTAAPFMQDTIHRLKVQVKDPHNGSRDFDTRALLVQRIIENHNRLVENYEDNDYEGPLEMHDTGVDVHEAPRGRNGQKRLWSYNPHEPSDNEWTPVHTDPSDVMGQINGLTQAVRDMKERILRLRASTIHSDFEHSRFHHSPEEMSLKDIWDYAHAVQAAGLTKSARRRY